MAHYGKKSEKSEFADVVLYAGIWWFRSRDKPSTERPAFILAIDGNPNPCLATGSVAMVVDGWKGKPKASCTLRIISESRCSASFGMTGWRDRSARHLETIF